VQIKDKVTGKMRDETDDERKAREAEEARAAEEGDDDDELADDEVDPVKLRAEIKRLTTDRDKWKGLSKKHEARSKENKDAADELKKIKDEKLTDTEKAQKAQKELETGKSSAEQEAMRLRVALRKGLNETQAKRLVGTTEEELEADADELVKTFKPSQENEEEEEGEQGEGGARRVPRERVRSGSGKTKEVPFDPKKVVDTVYERSR
jgi:hypothetical protein